MTMNIGIDIGKKKLQACIKDDRGMIAKELSLENNSDGANELVSAVNGMPARAVIEATGNHWMRLYDVLSEHGIQTVLANPIKTRIIAEARIKTDRLDSRVLADLLRGNLVAESYVPTKEERDWRSIVRQRASLVRMGVEIKNRIQSLLDRYELKNKPELTDLFGKKGMELLESIELDNSVDQAILDSDLKLLNSLNEQIDTSSRETLHQSRFEARMSNFS